MFTFNESTMTFSNSRGTIDNVKVSRKGGRYSYHAAQSGRLLASGMDPRDFARSFWYATDVEIVSTTEVIL